MYIESASPAPIKTGLIPTGIRVVILESESRSRARLRSLISCEPEFVIAGECESWFECERLIGETLPELLIARSELLPSRWLQEDSCSFAFPVVIAVDEGAAPQGSRFGIIDRVDARLEAEAVHRSILRARMEIFSRKAAELSYLLNCYALDAALQGTTSANEGIHSDLKPGDVDFAASDFVNALYFEADRNYVRVHTMHGNYEIRQTMNRLLSRIDPAAFLRIHRSVIIKVSRLRDVDWLNGVPVSVILEGGVKLRIGPNYRSAIGELLSRKAA